ncbi:hypothetical protein KO528_14580 [Saccharophagus degradans]|uniref:Uncharacterized protein n=1 Tax=Saccharophagus degradans TaxID=86304 RepID=A0AAW7X7J3_9GAMM|nr:hypothetical protein [Saccharophagus degradans]MBU2986586.1 hypothetical protein [Saccharophagus degradans]MDO6422591.1 hypothetical protein [Saccharophagus degradans]MDO6609101.1 hypothetical protein [Saccharophagus degradans]
MTPDYKPLIIAGQNSGTPVQLSKTQAQFYNNLEPMARAGNYWANLIIKELQSLSSGHIKRNVFVSNTPKNANFTHFQMLLPGCRAYVLKCSSGKYLVYKMKLDDNYPLLQSTGKRPGLHQVKRQGSNWHPAFIENGHISNHPTPIVSVSDGYKNAYDAAYSSASDIKASGLIGSYVLERQGFDMHFTPGTKIGGLTQINQALNAANDVTLYDSAVLLAQSMEQAKESDGILWLTQGGGSGVFTQAMSILKSRGVSFKDKEHHVYFSHPTTNFVNAQALAMDLGMNFDRDNLNIRALNFDELVGGLKFGGDFIAGYQRLKQDPEYTAVNYGVDALKGVSRNWQSISVTAACTAAVSAACGMGATSFAIPAVITTATAMAGLGNTLFQQWLPDRYNRLKAKL